MEIRAADVECVDVARDDAAEEEDTVEEGIGVGPGQEEDGEWREENGDECQHQAVEHLLFFGGGFCLEAGGPVGR